MHESVWPGVGSSRLTQRAACPVSARVPRFGLRRRDRSRARARHLVVVDPNRFAGSRPTRQLARRPPQITHREERIKFTATPCAPGCLEIASHQRDRRQNHRKSRSLRSCHARSQIPCAPSSSDHLTKINAPWGLCRMLAGVCRRFQSRAAHYVPLEAFRFAPHMEDFP